MPIRYWLLKTEPGDYSFADLLEQKRTVWDGITNPLALQNLRSARGGDLVLVYHTGAVRSAVGIARVLAEPYPDPKQRDPRRMVVDVEAVRPLARSVSLDEIKKTPELRGSDLVRLPRLSFVPVSREQWNILLKMSGTPH